MRSNRFKLLSALALLAMFVAACDSAAQKANEAQVTTQQQQIEQMQKEIAELKAQQSYQTPQPPPGSCDREVMAQATRQGGEKYAAGDFIKALGYYQDALTACPGDARAELNVGRAYEAEGNRDQAVTYYQMAASSGDPTEKAAEQDAHIALDRLGGGVK